MGAMWKRPFLWSVRFISLVCLAGLGSVSETAADLYRWTDTRGVVHIIDDRAAIPEAYQDQVITYLSSSSVAKVTSSPLLIAPSHNYSVRSQGAFAQKIAVDFGLIKNGSTDALGPLRGIGIQPAGGWKVAHALDPDTVDQLAAAARRAATAQRLTLSADGAEAIIRQAAVDFIPSPQPVESAAEGGPEIIVIEQPPQIIEVIHEPYYVETPVIVYASRHRRRHIHPGRSPRYFSHRGRETYRRPHSIQRTNPSIRPSSPSITLRSPGRSIGRGPFIASPTAQASAPFIHH